MNKTELTERIAANVEVSKAVVKKTLDATTEAIKEALAAGDKVQPVGFGILVTTECPAREGINLRSKEKIKIAAEKVVKLEAGTELANTVNR